MGEKVYGLLGRKLGHSWSAPIHAALGCADYRLIELEPEELGAFLAREDIGGLNVTIPYKRDVMAYCDVLDPMAEAIGSVNTLVRRADGKLYGYNTDAAGFCFMAQRAGIGFAGKKTLVLGSGGVVKTPDNYAALHQNGRIYQLLRPLELLPTDGRPLSQGADLAAMWAERAPLYERFRDAAIDNSGTVEQTAQAIWRDFCENSGH